jgi:hypothetical protein
MPEISQARLKAALQSDVPVEQGLRLTGAFRKLRDDGDRQQVIALAEKLLDAQNAKSK